MDFKELLNVADYNKAEAKSEASVKRYSSVLPPPKKIPRAGVQTDCIQRFLAKKKAEERAKEADAQKKKEQLLALRAQNSKNNKKAKIMASRTKDNDFSRIKLTEDEIESKKKMEMELIRKNLEDKKERMKARLEIQEQEKLIPKKRKRKSKHSEINTVDDVEHDSHFVDQNQLEDRNMKNSQPENNDRRLSEKNNVIKKPRPPPPPAMSFHELLKVAEKKQYEPVVIPVKKKEEEKLMTKKERRLMEQERDRLRRKQELLQKGLEPSINYKSTVNNKSSIGPKMSNTAQTSSVSKKSPVEKATVKKPVVIHVERDSKPTNDLSKPKTPSGNPYPSKSTQIIKPSSQKNKIPESNNKIPNRTSSISNEKIQKHSLNKSAKSPVKPIPKENFSSAKEEIKKKILLPKKNGIKIAPAPTPAPEKQIFSLDEDAIAAIEQKIKEKIQKEMEEKVTAQLAAKFGLTLSGQNTNREAPSPALKKTVNDKIIEKSKPSLAPNKAPAALNKDFKKPENHRIVNEKMLNARKDIDRLMMAKKMAAEKSLPRRPVLEKKPFHKNPYLDPPRRLLEPQRPSKPPLKRRIESDDEDDDDDMSDFIDDGPSQNDEDYSKYIKEIFGYDRNKYVDDDDDDIVETSYVEQLKEEVNSAKLGFLEDLEEERLQQMERKKKKLKK